MCAGACSLQALPRELHARIWHLLDRTVLKRQCYKDQCALGATCRAFRALWLKPTIAREKYGHRRSAREEWRRRMWEEAAEALEARVSRRSLMINRQPHEDVNPLMGDHHMHLESVLHLNDQALRYLSRQTPYFLQSTLGPAFAKCCAKNHMFLLQDEDADLPSTAPVFSLTLVHLRPALSPHELAQLEHFVLDMPATLHGFETKGGNYPKIASCCWLKGPGGRLPFFWQTEHFFTFHRDL